VIWGEAFIDAPGEVTVKPSKSVAPKGVLGAGTIRASTYHCHRAHRACCPASSRTRNWSGLIRAMVPDRMPKSLLIVGSVPSHRVRLVSTARSAPTSTCGSTAADLPIEDRGDRPGCAQELSRSKASRFDRCQSHQAEKRAPRPATIEKGGKSQTITPTRHLAVGVVAT